MQTNPFLKIFYLTICNQTLSHCVAIQGLHSCKLIINDMIHWAWSHFISSAPLFSSSSEYLIVWDHGASYPQNFRAKNIHKILYECLTAEGFHFIVTCYLPHFLFCHVSKMHSNPESNISWYVCATKRMKCVTQFFELPLSRWQEPLDTYNRIRTNITAVKCMLSHLPLEFTVLRYCFFSAWCLQKDHNRKPSRV